MGEGCGGRTRDLMGKFLYSIHFSFAVSCSALQ